jgi:hypothetical protein
MRLLAAAFIVCMFGCARAEPTAIDRLHPCSGDDGPTDAYCGTGPFHTRADHFQQIGPAPWRGWDGASRGKDADLAVRTRTSRSAQHELSRDREPKGSRYMVQVRSAGLQARVPTRVPPGGSHRSRRRRIPPAAGRCYPSVSEGPSVMTTCDNPSQLNA